MKILKHGGNIGNLARTSGIPEKEILDFSANINPLGPPEWLRPLISSRLSGLVHYPDPECTALTEAFCARWGVSPDEVLFGNGSTELLYLIPRAFGKERALIAVPAYADYASACEQAGIPAKKWLLKEEEGFALDLVALEGCIAGEELVFLGQPNNPTGLCVEAKELRGLARRHPAALFVVDEAFADFVDGIGRLVSDRPENIIVLGSLTKFYAIPGLRLGFAAGSPGRIGVLRRMMPPWSVNSLAQAVGEAALRDRDFEEKSRACVTTARARLEAGLKQLPGLFVYPGKANFLLVRIDRGDLDAPALAGRLLQKGIAIRVCGNFEGLDGRFFRVAVRTEEENGRLCEALSPVLGTTTRAVRQRKRAIMFQGTSSNAGKSVLAAALCRILLQDGFASPRSSRRTCRSTPSSPATAARWGGRRSSRPRPAGSNRTSG